MTRLKIKNPAANILLSFYLSVCLFDTHFVYFNIAHLTTDCHNGLLFAKYSSVATKIVPSTFPTISLALSRSFSIILSMLTFIHLLVSLHISVLLLMQCLQVYCLAVLRHVHIHICSLSNFWMIFYFLRVCMSCKEIAKKWLRQSKARRNSVRE